MSLIVLWKQSTLSLGLGHIIMLFGQRSQSKEHTGKGRYKIYPFCFLINSDKLRTTHYSTQLIWMCSEIQSFLKERDHREIYSILIGNIPLEEQSGQSAEITRAVCSKRASEIHNFLSQSWKSGWLLQASDISFWTGQSLMEP